MWLVVERVNLEWRVLLYVCNLPHFLTITGLISAGDYLNLQIIATLHKITDHILDCNNIFIAIWNWFKCSYYISECLDGYFGKGCLKQCHCDKDALCDKINGKCPKICAPGWYGRTCQNGKYYQTVPFVSCTCMSGSTEHKL